MKINELFVFVAEHYMEKPTTKKRLYSTIRRIIVNRDAIGISNDVDEMLGNKVAIQRFFNSTHPFVLYDLKLIAAIIPPKKSEIFVAKIFVPKKYMKVFVCSFVFGSVIGCGIAIGLLKMIKNSMK